MISPQNLKKIRRLRRHLFGGVAGQSYAKDDLLEQFFLILKNHGFKPQHVLDVGANKGNWTRVALRFFPEAKYSLLEPQANMKEVMLKMLQQNPQVGFYPLGAGRAEGEFLFTHTDRGDSCTFRYSSAEAEEMGFAQTRCPVVRLDRFVADNELPMPEMIKIDAEGCDLEVLEGAGNLLNFADVILVEAAVGNPFIPNTLSEVLSVMTARGFRLLDLTDLNRPWGNRVLWLVECAFVRVGSFLDQALSNRSLSR